MNIGVYRSVDFGVTWTQTALNNTTVWDLAVSCNNVFAATDIGVFISNNNGTTWRSSTLPEETFGQLNFPAEVFLPVAEQGRVFGYHPITEIPGYKLLWIQRMFIRLLFQD